MPQNVIYSYMDADIILPLVYVVNNNEYLKIVVKKIYSLM